MHQVALRDAKNVVRKHLEEARCGFAHIEIKPYY